jgi:glycosyltransferase involved in cell wall biosynthesis
MISMNLIKKIIKKIMKYDFVFHYFGIKKYDLIIYDNIYPHPVSGFRLEEFTVLLKEFKTSKIILFPKAYPVLKTSISVHKNHIDLLISKNLELDGKLKLQRGLVNINTKLFYCIFIDNIYEYINYLEKFKINFVFTLYPGGGFQINNKDVDFKLRRVLSSTFFKKVIVTQNIIKDYLIDNKFCTEDKIEYIFGSVVPQNSLLKNSFNRHYYSVNKKTLDISFCAAKYMPSGKDKGYDVFIELALLLSKKYDFINYHIIGGFDSNDIDISEIADKVKFYGYQDFKSLEKIYNYIDIIVSPNKPFVFDKGSFDGFPLGAIVEAVLNGVLAVVTDDLNQNTQFTNYEDLIISNSDSKSIEKVIVYLINNPGKMIEIANKGKFMFQEVYSNNIQMQKRIEVLNKVLNESN